jgi:hypothetical protein
MGANRPIDFPHQRLAAEQTRQAGSPAKPATGNIRAENGKQCGALPLECPGRSRRIPTSGRLPEIPGKVWLNRQSLGQTANNPTEKPSKWFK